MQELLALKKAWSRMADEPSGTAQNGNLDKVLDREQSEGSYFKTMVVNDQTVASAGAACIQKSVASSKRKLFARA